MDHPNPSCRICQTPSGLFFQDNRQFFKCPQCWLIFTLETATGQVAENHYKQQWEATDPHFWQSQVDMLIKIFGHFGNPRKILDFGSGSGEITHELRQRGLNATPLDPMVNGYLKDQNFAQEYDAIIALEVIEHLPNLWEELKELDKVLVNDGIMLFSTALTDEWIDLPQASDRFSNWTYKDDQTHVSFFCTRAIEKLGEMGKWETLVIGHLVFILHKVRC